MSERERADDFSEIYSFLDEDRQGGGEGRLSRTFSFSTPSPFPSEAESFATSNNSFLTTSSISPLADHPSLTAPDSAITSQSTEYVYLSAEQMISQDPETAEQMARIRKELEEVGKLEAKNLELKKLQHQSTTAKERIKVPVDSALPVALHSRESKAFDDESSEHFDSIDGEFEGRGGGVEEQRQKQRQSKLADEFGFRIVDEEHANYVLMYDMLTGIRTAVSKCQAKLPRPLTPRDFKSSQKLAFDLTGNEETPSSRYDFKFKDYAPWAFRSLREIFAIDTADYLVSLTGKYVLSELYSPGKSGSLFYYSQDYRFIIKTIRESEHLFLRKILPHYHRHIQENPNTLLVRFYGLHRVQLPDRRKIYFVVMGNIFPMNHSLRSIYDLKGSTHGRWCPEPNDVNAAGGDDGTGDGNATGDDNGPSDGNGAGDANSSSTALSGTDAPFTTLRGRAQPGPKVLKDLNWLDRREKLILGPFKATKLMNQLKIDCKFLAKLNIMDYSLLVGLHSVPDGSSTQTSGAFEFYREHSGFRSSYEDNSDGPEIYYLGVIDILTPYSMTKKLEHVFKSLVFSRETISAVNPTAYARRFLSFMYENILQNVRVDYSRKELPDPPEIDAQENLSVRRRSNSGLSAASGENENTEDHGSSSSNDLAAFIVLNHQGGE